MTFEKLIFCTDMSDILGMGTFYAKILAAPMLCLMSLLLTACTPPMDTHAPAPLSPLNLHKDHIQIRFTRDVDSIIQRQGNWLDLDLELTNISDQPILLKEAGTCGPWDHNAFFFKAQRGAIRFNTEDDSFLWYTLARQKTEIPLTSGLLFPGESLRCTISPRLLVAPSETRIVNVTYFVFRNEDDVARKMYFPTEGKLGTHFRRLDLKQLQQVKVILPHQRLAILKSPMHVASTSTERTVAFHPEYSAIRVESAMFKVGVKEHYSGSYLFSTALQAWVFQKGKDCWVVASDDLYQVRHCDLRIFDIVDRAGSSIPFRTSNLKTFQYKTAIQHISWTNYDLGFGARMYRHSLAELLKEAGRFQWKIKPGTCDLNTACLEILIP